MVTVTWLALNGSVFIIKQVTGSVEFLDTAYWGETLVTTSLTISLTVNAIVTSLIVLKIIKVYREVHSTSEDRDLGIRGANDKHRSIIFIIIESGMAMFSIQLVRVVLYILNLDATVFVIGINQMFNVIFQSVIFFSLY